MVVNCTAIMRSVSVSVKFISKLEEHLKTIVTYNSDL